jgi:putative hemolysin
VNLPISDLLIIVLLTILEGFFVASEIALVSVRRSRIDQLVEEGDRGARRVRRLLDDPGRFLAVCQLGLTFIGFFASAFAAVRLVDGLPACSSRSASSRARERVALLIVTALRSLTIVFGELFRRRSPWLTRNGSPSHWAARSRCSGGSSARSCRS